MPCQAVAPMRSAKQQGVAFLPLEPELQPQLPPAVLPEQAPVPDIPSNHLNRPMPRLVMMLLSNAPAIAGSAAGTEASFAGAESHRFPRRWSDPGRR